MYKTSNWANLRLSEKIRLYGQKLDESYAKYVDKLSAKDIIKEKCGDLINIPKTYKILNNIVDISEVDIIIPCLIKSTHASGWNILITKKEDIDISNIKLTLQKYNVKFHEIYKSVLSYEKQYLSISPRFYIEECINDKYFGYNCKALVYMFHCFKGEPKLVRIYDKYKQKANTYDTLWNLLDKEELFKINKPNNLDIMFQIARNLSNEFDYVRIDLFLDSEEKIYFSEYTFTPNGGSPFMNRKLDAKYGKCWN
jgi:hypothetical protein